MMPDLEAAVLARSLLHFSDHAPALDLEIVPPVLRLLEAPESNTVDALIGVVADAPAGIRKRKLYEDRFVTLMRADHPAAATNLPVGRYLELGHIVVERYAVRRKGWTR